MLSIIKYYLALYAHKRCWRKTNKHNETYAVNIFNPDHVKVGNYTYGELNVLNANEHENLYIGNFCSIASNVTFVLNADHNTKTLSTYPFKVKCLKSCKFEAISKGDIIVDDDVWLGTNAVILSGVHIGQGAVVAAGAVVTNDVPPYAVVGGIPAKILKFRFDSQIIHTLLSIDFSKLSKKWVSENLDLLYQEMNEETLQKVLKKIKEIS